MSNSTCCPNPLLHNVQAVRGNLALIDPRLNDRGIQVLLAGAYPGHVTLFGCFYGCVPQNLTHLFQSHSTQKCLDCEGIAEHVRVAAFVQTGELKQLCVTALPVAGDGFGEAVAGPEKVLRVGCLLGAARDSEEGLRNVWGDRAVYGVACLPLVNNDAVHLGCSVVDYLFLCKGNCVSNAQAGPSHQFSECADALPSQLLVVVVVNTGAIGVDVSGVNNFLILFGFKVVGLGWLYPDLPKGFCDGACSVAWEPSTALAEPQEAYGLLLTFVTAERGELPCPAPFSQCLYAKFSYETQTFVLGECEQALLAGLKYVALFVKGRITVAEGDRAGDECGYAGFDSWGGGWGFSFGRNLAHSRVRAHHLPFPLPQPREFVGGVHIALLGRWEVLGRALRNAFAIEGATDEDGAPAFDVTLVPLAARAMRLDGVPSVNFQHVVSLHVIKVIGTNRRDFYYTCLHVIDLIGLEAGGVELFRPLIARQLPPDTAHLAYSFPSFPSRLARSGTFLVPDVSDICTPEVSYV